MGEIDELYGSSTFAFLRHSILFSKIILPIFSPPIVNCNCFPIKILKHSMQMTSSSTKCQAVEELPHAAEWNWTLTSHLSHTTYKSNSKWIKSLNVWPESEKLYRIKSRREHHWVLIWAMISQDSKSNDKKSKNTQMGWHQKKKNPISWCTTREKYESKSQHASDRKYF